MRVKCVSNRRAALSTPSSLAAYDKNVHLDEVGLVVGQTYPVFGISMRHAEPWYLVCEEEDDTYPKPHLAAFFSIVDPAIPRDWAVAVEGNAGAFAILPRAWADDPSFLEKLIDEEPEAIALFERIRQSI